MKLKNIVHIKFTESRTHLQIYNSLNGKKKEKMRGKPVTNGLQ